MHIALRVDASATIGTGHLRRCLSLAQALIETGADVCLVVRRLDAVAAQVLHGQSLPVHWLPAPHAGQPAPKADRSAAHPAPVPHQAWAGVDPGLDVTQTADALRAQPPDWVVVDHYAFDARWHDAVRAALGCRIAVIDDVADRLLSPDVLIDHNWHPDHRAKYAGRLTRDPAAWLVGPRFALLAATYRTAPRYAFNPQVRSIGIFMGGTDPGGSSARVLDALRRDVGFTGPVEVVSTSASPHLPALRAACAAWPQTTLTLDLPDLAAFFTRHDLQIGAGGGATWERCCIGAPTVLLVVADNQLPGAQALQARQIVQTVDVRSVPGPQWGALIAPPIAELIEQPTMRRAMADRAQLLVDGFGVTRVSLRLCRGNLRLRRAVMADAETLHGWRNHPSIRAVSGNPDPIAMDGHVAWLSRVVAAPDRCLFVGLVGNVGVGSIRFDSVEHDRAEVSLYLAPGLDGLGLGSALLRAGERALLEALPSARFIDATVLPDNETSARLFVRAGYRGGPTRYQKALFPSRPEELPTIKSACSEDAGNNR